MNYRACHRLNQPCRGARAAKVISPKISSTNAARIPAAPSSGNGDEKDEDERNAAAVEVCSENGMSSSPSEGGDEASADAADDAALACEDSDDPGLLAEEAKRLRHMLSWAVLGGAPRPAREPTPVACAPRISLRFHTPRDAQPQLQRRGVCGPEWGRTQCRGCMPGLEHPEVQVSSRTTHCPTCVAVSKARLGQHPPRRRQRDAAATEELVKR